MATVGGMMLFGGWLWRESIVAPLLFVVGGFSFFLGLILRFGVSGLIDLFR